MGEAWLVVWLAFLFAVRANTQPTYTMRTAITLVVKSVDAQCDTSCAVLLFLSVHGVWPDTSVGIPFGRWVDMAMNFDGDTFDLLCLVATRILLMPILGIIAVQTGMSYERSVHSRKRGRGWRLGWSQSRENRDMLQPINECGESEPPVLPTEAVVTHNRRSAFKRNALMLTAFTLSTAWQV
jgi:hypothetical protein